MGLRGAILIVGVLGGLALSGQAFAQAVTPNTAYASDSPAPYNTVTNRVLSIDVTSTVGAACGFKDNTTATTDTAPNDSFNAPDLDTGFTHDTNFGLNCNVAARVAVVSLNGGLLTPGTAPTGYTTLAPYSVTLNLISDTSSPQSGTCTVDTLKASSGSPCSFRGPASTSQGLITGSAINAKTGSYLRISAPVYAGATNLVASTGNSYTDTLTITLSPSV